MDGNQKFSMKLDLLKRPKESPRVEHGLLTRKIIKFMCCGMELSGGCQNGEKTYSNCSRFAYDLRIEF